MVRPSGRIKGSKQVLYSDLFRQRHPRDPVRLQHRQYVAGEAADLVHEHLVRQHAAIELIRTVLTPAGR